MSQHVYPTIGETATTDSASSTPNSERYKAFAQPCNQPRRIVNQLPLDMTMKMLNQTECGEKIRSAASVTSSAEDESKDEVTTEDGRFSATSRVKSRVSVGGTFFPGVSLQKDSTVKALLSSQTSEEPQSRNGLLDRRMNRERSEQHIDGDYLEVENIMLKSKQRRGNRIETHDR